MRAFFMFIGTLLVADTVFLLTRTNGNLGVWLPAIMGIPLLLAGLFYIDMGRVLKVAFIGAYCLATVFFGGMSVFLYAKGHVTPPPSADALIVLGCGLRGRRVSLTLQNRLNTAIGYLNQNPNTIVVVAGGQGHGELIPEAHAMEEYLVSRGISKARIIREDKSLSTLENFANSKALLDQRLGEGTYRVVFVTNHFHIYRAGRIAHTLGIPADGLGTQSLWYIAFNDYLRESIAVTMYALTGRI